MKFYETIRKCTIDGCPFVTHGLIPANSVDDALSEARKSIAGEKVVSVRIFLNNVLVYEG